MLHEWCGEVCSGDSWRSAQRLERRAVAAHALPKAEGTNELASSAPLLQQLGLIRDGGFHGNAGCCGCAADGAAVAAGADPTIYSSEIAQGLLSSQSRSISQSRSTSKTIKMPLKMLHFHSAVSPAQ
jgi:hypothetical protein